MLSPLPRRRFAVNPDSLFPRIAVPGECDVVPFARLPAVHPVGRGRIVPTEPLLRHRRAGHEEKRFGVGGVSAVQVNRPEERPVILFRVAVPRRLHPEDDGPGPQFEICDVVEPQRFGFDLYAVAEPSRNRFQLLLRLRRTARKRRAAPLAERRMKQQSLAQWSRPKHGADSRQNAGQPITVSFHRIPPGYRCSAICSVPAGGRRNSSPVFPCNRLSMKFAPRRPSSASGSIT